MAKEIFKNLPNTTTPLNASKLNGLLDGDETMGNVIVDSIKTKNIFNINGEVNIKGNNGTDIGTDNTVSGNILTSNYNSANSHGYGQKFTNLNGKTFTFSAKCVSMGTSSTGAKISVYDNNVLKVEKNITTNNYDSITYTATSNLIVVAFSTAGGTGAQFTDIQVEIGSSRTNYVEYQGIGYVSGQNSNGYYVKYDDGRLECWNIKNLGTLTFSASGSMYLANYTSGITFPIEFTNPPMVVANTQNTGDYAWSSVYAIERSKTSISRIGFLRTTTSSSNVYVGYHAIGRWK